MGKCYSVEEIFSHVCDNICKYPNMVEPDHEEELFLKKYCDKCILTNVSIYFKENTEDDN